MSIQIIAGGDSIDHGGKVIRGSPTRDIDSKPIANIGDEIACPQVSPGGKPHGVNKILTGHANVAVDDIADRSMAV